MVFSKATHNKKLNIVSPYCKLYIHICYWKLVVFLYLSQNISDFPVGVSPLTHIEEAFTNCTLFITGQLFCFSS